MIKIIEHNTSTVTTIPPHPIPPPLSLILNYAALDFNFTSWMSPANLRVLRSEQSSGNLPGLKELAMQKNHLQHVSPLSMVGSKRPGKHGKSKLKRRSSWKDAIRGFTNSSGDEREASKPKTTMERASSTPGSSLQARTSRRERAQTLPYPVDRGALADAESEDQDDSEPDFEHLREEDRPIQARVRHFYNHDETSLSLVPTPSVLEKQQEALSAAVAEANSKASNKKNGEKSEPIGTRLTMTSRAGYFQDRVISPSMVRRIVF